MADYMPSANGLWSTTAWLTAVGGGAASSTLVPPGFIDDVYADGKTITIDTNINVASLRTTTAPRTGGSAGGGFQATNNTSLTANLFGGPSTCLTFSSAAPNFFRLVGNINASTTTAPGINFTCFLNSGVVTISGNILGGNVANGGRINSGLWNFGTANVIGSIRGGFGGNVNMYGADNSGTINLTGGVFGGSVGGNSYGINNPFGSTINLSGSVVGGTGGGGAPVDLGILNGGTLNMVGIIRGGAGTSASNQRGVSNTGTLNLTGFVIGGALASSNSGILNTGTINIAGSAIGSSAGSVGIDSSAGTITINGAVIGGGAAGISNTATSGSININGVAIGGGAAGISNTGTSPIYIKKVIGGPGGPLNPPGGTAAGVSNAQNGQVYVEEVEFGAQGASPITGPVFMTPRSTNVTVMNQGLFNFTPVTLVRATNYPGLVPLSSDVRAGVVYGNGDFTGAMIVPSPNTVQSGIQVDSNGIVGTAALSPESVWNFSRNASLSAGSIGERVRNALTIQAAGAIIASFNLSGVN